VPRIRQAQIEEMIAFADATRRPENVAVLVGDLNVDAHGRGPDGDIDEGAQPAAALQRSFADAGYDDAWALAGQGPGWTCDLLLAPNQFRVDAAEPDLCAEPAAAATGHHEVRIDYAFLQRPVPAHGFDLRLDRVRRRPFPRPAGAPDLDQIATMSDHLGLHLELHASPR
jgi:endonuclease/exonuclease/phosphatase family metal-dependent hydrolase